MGLAKHLIAASFALLLASLGQGAAAMARDLAGDDAGAALACTGSQCALADLKSATRAIAMSAGAKPAPVSDHAPLLPESSHTMILGDPHTLSPGTSQNQDVEPVLFAVILPSSERTQLCIEDGNLLGMSPTCSPKPVIHPGAGPGYDCERTDPRFGIKLACRIPRDVPEPETPLLLVIALLGLAVARARRIAGKGAQASL